MYQRHPTIEWQFAAEHRAQILADAAHRRMLAQVRATQRSSLARWVMLAMVGAVPLAMVLVLMVALR